MDYLESDLEPEVYSDDEDYGIALPARRSGQYVCGRPRTSCHVTADMCLHIVHKAMRKHQWKRAAKFLTSYFQTIENRNSERQDEAPGIIWRIGNEILLQHPKSSNEAVHVFHEYMKNMGLKQYLPISLEQAFHIMCYGDLQDVHPVLATAESWRYGQLTITENKTLKLVQAYKALLNYRSSVEKRSAMSQKDLDYAAQSSASQEMDSYARQAANVFKDILEIPGVWDPFVLGYVDILESSKNELQAEKVLRDYAYNPKNPVNPNALMYLYEFLKRHEAPAEKLMKVLMDLHDMTPSHKLMLDFVLILNNSDSENHQRFALHVLFDFLDFSDWKENLNAWSYLAKLMKKTFRLDRGSWILNVWKLRSPWWPSYHFTRFHARKDCKSCVQLAMKKALVAGMLQGPACAYSTFVCASKKCEGQNIKRLERSIQKYNCENIPKTQSRKSEPEAAQPMDT